MSSEQNFDNVKISEETRFTARSLTQKDQEKFWSFMSPSFECS